MVKKIQTTLILFLISALFGCSAKTAAPVKHSTSFFAMDTVMEISVYSDQDCDALLQQCRSRVSDLDDQLSVHNPSGDLYRLNLSDGDPVTVASETRSILQTSSEICALSGGAFNIATGSLTDLWGFETDSPSVPDPDAVQALIPLPGPECLQFEDESVSFLEPASLNLGAIAKGYCSDDLVTILKSHGISSALISLGGNISALGSKPDGTPWKIAIQDPSDPSGYIGVVSVRDRSVITSGSYQRYFVENGKSYHHILDPKTGFPAESGLLSVTVVSESGTYADALSTCFFVMGVEDSIALLNRLPEHIKPDGVLFVLDDHTVQIAGELNFVPAEGIFPAELP